MIDLSLLIIFPLALTFLSLLLLNRRLVKGLVWLTFIGEFLLLAKSISFIGTPQAISYLGGFRPPFGISLVLTPMSLFFLFLVWSFAGLFWILIGNRKTIQSSRFFLLIMLLLTGSSGLILSGDIFNIFIFFEITALASIGLVGSSTNAKGLRSSMVLLVWSAIGSSFLLLGIALLYQMTGTLNLAHLAALVPGFNPATLAIIFFFILIGLSVELKLIPSNLWVPGLFSGLSWEMIMLFSLVVPLPFIYLLIRLFGQLFPLSLPFIQDPYSVSLVLGVIGLLSFLSGSLAALTQQNLKRLFGFSSISFLGLITTLIACRNMGLILAASYLILGFLSAKTLALVIISATGPRNITTMSDLQGWNHTASKRTLGLGLAVLGMTGMPLFGSFWGKWSGLKNLLPTHPMLGFILVLGFLIESMVFFRLFAACFKSTENLNPLRKPSFSQGLAISVLTLFVISLGWMPTFWSQLIKKSFLEINTPATYIELTRSGGRS